MQSLSGRDKAYVFVRDQVLTSPAATGTFLNEQDLATRIGVSRTPVREALLMLQAEGLVEMVPKRGAHVPAMSGRQISELMDLRGVLERHAATTSLRAGNVPASAMRSILVEQEDLADNRTDDAAKDFIDLDGKFHQILVDAAGSELLSRTYAGLRARQLRVGLTALFSAADRQRNVCTEHEAIVTALEGGDEGLVQRAIDDHLEVTLQILLRA
ncbi:GntR family transcriptional regulator [Rhodococcus sp. BP-252]|uniref:GntR family transcriptional regulator n=1 Tax=Rhodococcoides kyotonense TaxID=398843 RepID=A0A177YH80_9NOCA|nr:MULTISPECIES: GntR family transcriptional regulator [Rhodococcus]MBY6413067.1 GntR family transcriptional regulator [Rhodococcus sp. BP-320]MBY6417770.1 GntR family transcriptional regulator [Rhodococcus sp. BP-321]MBY6423920.1 GntR family transcriptional regulator [Rhodococcus sp. BP-324]MBY6427809.1 GntR family transcriptional regulator [Rhodococcus sp. BP-323]MBY6431808.1 GntR family transcriptional regulator [Rhodococcus sp. BP-322]